MPNPTPYTLTQIHYLTTSYLNEQDIPFDPDKVPTHTRPIIQQLLFAKINGTSRIEAYQNSLAKLPQKQAQTFQSLLEEGAIQNLVTQHRLTPHQQTILRHLLNHPTKHTVSQIAAHLEANVGNTHKRLKKLTTHQLITRHQNAQNASYQINPLVIFTPCLTNPIPYPHTFMSEIEEISPSQS